MRGWTKQNFKPVLWAAVWHACCGEWSVRKVCCRMFRPVKRSRAAAMVDLTGEEDEAEIATRAGRWLSDGVQRTDTAYAERHALSLEDDDVVQQQAGPSGRASEERLDDSGKVAPSDHGRHRNAGATSEAGPSEAWVSCNGPALMLCSTNQSGHC